MLVKKVWTGITAVLKYAEWYELTHSDCFFSSSGNGPSAISLSFMLSGNAPYYVGTAADEHLHKRLSFADGETLFMQDLEELATVSVTKLGRHKQF